MFEFAKKCLEKGKKYLEKGLGLVTTAAIAICFVVVGVASPASAAMTSLIDFSALATDITPLITIAVTSAAGLGAVVLAAKLCWSFFKKFTRG